jgi:hypothetical protein
MAEQFEYLDSRRMLWVAPLTIAASVAAVLAVREVAIRVIHPAPTYEPLGLGAPVLDTILGCLGAILVFANLDSVRKYRRVAAVVLLVSFLPDVGLATSHEMGGGWPEASFLMIMHVVVWAICVTLLPGLSMTRISDGSPNPRSPLSIL